MSNSNDTRNDLPDIARQPLNSDGKGTSGFLLDWHRSEPQGVVIKPRRQLLAEFFTSMLVLSAEFKYRPAPGVPNYLYLVDGRWSLSLIDPGEWSENRRRGFVGTCTLQEDMTWSIEPSDRLRTDDTLVAAVGSFFDAFCHMLDTDLTLEEILPFCARRMSYYQRLYASAMSRSLRAAVTIGGQRGISARRWREALPARSAAQLIDLSRK